MANYQKYRPKQPQAFNMLKYDHNDHYPNDGMPHSAHAEEASAPHDSCQDSNTWGSAEGVNDAYGRLDNNLRDFVYGISRGYSVRMACRMSGEAYENMLDYLNPGSPYFKPELLKLVEKARWAAYARHIEALNSATDWHAHAFWLERRVPREYAPPRVGIPLEEEERAHERKALIRMTPETLEALSAAYDAEHGSPSEERET